MMMMMMMIITKKFTSHFSTVYLCIRIINHLRKADKMSIVVLLFLFLFFFFFVLYYSYSQKKTYSFGYIFYNYSLKSKQEKKFLLPLLTFFLSNNVHRQTNNQLRSWWGKKSFSISFTFHGAPFLISTVASATVRDHSPSS